MSKKPHPPELPPAPYAAIPHKVMKSAVYASLSDAAIRLLLELTSFHDGYNNGALFSSYRTLEKRGMSHSRAERAFAELIQAGLIVKTKDANKRENTADCYMLTWMPATSSNRDETKKDMPLLPSPMPVGKYLNAAPLVKDVRLRGAARKTRSAKLAREINGPDNCNDQDHQPPSTPACTGTMSTLRPTGQGVAEKQQNLSRPRGHPVTPHRTPYPAPGSTPVPPDGKG
jgi:hypothetical protein